MDFLMLIFAAVVLTALIGFVVFWCSQFIALMLMADNDFPGSYDKIVWAILFILLPLLGPFIFVFWKQARSMRRAEQRRSNELMSKVQAGAGKP